MNEVSQFLSEADGVATANASDMSFASMVDRFCLEQTALRARLARADAPRGGDHGEGLEAPPGAHQGGP